MAVKLVVLDNPAEVAKHASGMIAELVKSKPEGTTVGFITHIQAVLGLATGSTPEATYAELTRIHKEEGLSFSHTRTFNLDEYWGLSGDHEQSYRYFMNAKLFNSIDIPLWNTHTLNGKAANPELECEAYEKKILASGGVDLWLLGIGTNGHIAFNEPGSTVDSKTRMVALSAATIKANSDGRFFKDPKEVPRCALTAGVATILQSRKLVLLATGKGKAEAIRAAIKGDFSPNCPASLLQVHPDCTFIVDKDAASLL